MPMLGSKPGPPAIADPAAHYSAASLLYLRCAYIEAYRIFVRLVDFVPASLAPKVGLALCLIAAENYQMALEQLDGALSLAKGGVNLPTSPDDDVVKKLRAASYDACDHMVPLPYVLPAELVPYAKHVILRLQIDVCAKLGLRDRAEAIAAQFPPHTHKHVDDALGSL